MKLLRSAIGMATLVAFASLTPLAAAADVVPPGNSAATQYTETFPTSGGEAEANKEINGGGRTPSKVLGSGKAKKLEETGSDGKAAAAVVAETAPPVQPESAPEQSSSDAGHHSKHAAGGGGKSGGGTGGSGSGAGKAGGATQPSATESVATGEPNGSSGFGEVLAQATGSSSGQLGLLLPLLIIGTVVWSIYYLWRPRRQVG